MALRTAKNNLTGNPTYKLPFFLDNYILNIWSTFAVTGYIIVTGYRIWVFLLLVKVGLIVLIKSYLCSLSHISNSVRWHLTVLIKSYLYSVDIIALFDIFIRLHKFLCSHAVFVLSNSYLCSYAVRVCAHIWCLYSASNICAPMWCLYSVTNICTHDYVVIDLKTVSSHCWGYSVVWWDSFHLVSLKIW